VIVEEVKVDVCLFAFDLMFFNGSPLLDQPFRRRRALLRDRFRPIPRVFTWVESIDATSADSEAVLEFYKSATANQCEGIMVKVLDNLPSRNDVSAVEAAASAETNNPKAPVPEPTANDATSTGTKEKSTRRKALLATYEPDKRVESWLKVKKDYHATSDTLDLIPIAAWHGTGRKAQWWSPILLACRNPVTGSLEAVCKCMSGFTDKFYAANRERYSPGTANVLARRPSYVEYTSAIEPDVWFEPQEVWEIAFADVTVSPVYTAAIGLVHEDKGLSLRFPRFLKVRADKGIDEASESDFLAELYRKQEVKPPMEAEEAADNVEVDDVEGKDVGN
jgi:DNA ligase-1